MPSPPPAPRSSPRGGAGPGTASPATAGCWPRGTEQRLCGARGWTGHRPTQRRSTREGATALRLGGFCDFFKRHVQLQPRRAQQCCGLSPWRRGEEKGSAAQQQVPSALWEGSQEPTRRGDVLGPGSCSAGGDGPDPAPQPATATGTARPPLERGQTLAAASSRLGEGPRGNL